MGALIVPIIVIALVIGLVSAQRKSAEQQKQAAKRRAARANAAPDESEPSGEGVTMMGRGYTPVRTLAAPPEEEHSLRQESEEKRELPLGLFADADECVKAVIYSEIMRPKFR